MFLSSIISLTVGDDKEMVADVQGEPQACCCLAVLPAVDAPAVVLIVARGLHMLLCKFIMGLGLQHSGCGFRLLLHQFNIGQEKFRGGREGREAQRDRKG